MSTKPVTVVIPFFNMSKYIYDALASVENCPDGLCEVIVVNDGSTDPEVPNVLREIEKKGHKVVHQQNGGLGSARNAGIAVATSKYVLPLDADDKIRPQALLKAVDILQRESDVGVVYGHAKCFGASTHLMRSRKMFSPLNLAMPCLYYCSLIRRQVWLDLGGYESNREIMGAEDWDFWIRVSKSNWCVRQLNEIFFDYRVRPGSMVEDVIQRRNEMMQYLVRKHADLYAAEYLRYADMTNVAAYMKRWPIQFLARLITQACFPGFKGIYKKLRGERTWVGKTEK